jgi:hypothetical protein
MSENKVELSILSHCYKCHAPICQKVNLLNLVLGIEENQTCLICLAEEHSKQKEEIFHELKDYVKSRECFDKPWREQSDEKTCPRKSDCIFEICFKDNVY